MPLTEDLLPPRYHELAWIARGGMADVYRAIDEPLDRLVAVKVLSSRFVWDEDVCRRFRREGLAAARLSGDVNTVTIFDVGEWHGRPFIVMEHLGGGSLEQVLRRGPQPFETVLAWLAEAAASLDAAHALGVVHRDVKPGNLLLDDLGHVKVADFGIATAAGLDSFTQTGTVLGTAGYFAPEQASGLQATAASDCYALGVVAFELLTGTRPFDTGSLASDATAHVQAPIPSAFERNQTLPRAVDAVFRRALAKDPRERFSSCGQMVAALARSAASEATQRHPALVPPEPRTTVALPAGRPRRRLVAGAAVALVLAGAAGIGAAILSNALAPRRVGAPPGVTTRIAIKTVTAAGRTVTAPAPPPPARPPATTTAAIANANPYTLNNRGYELLLSHDYAAALPLLERAVASLHNPGDPVTAYANYNLGQTLVALGQCATALPFLSRALQLEPQRPEVHAAMRIAQACARRGSGA